MAKAQAEVTPLVCPRDSEHKTDDVFLRREPETGRLFCPEHGDFVEIFGRAAEVSKE